MNLCYPVTQELNIFVSSCTGNGRIKHSQVPLSYEYIFFFLVSLSFFFFSFLYLRSFFLILSLFLSFLLTFLFVQEMVYSFNNNLSIQFSNSPLYPTAGLHYFYLQTQFIPFLGKISRNTNGDLQALKKNNILNILTRTFTVN